MLKVIIGAGKTAFDGWISTQEEELNLLDAASFQKMFEIASVDCFLAEHVFEHLSFEEGLRAARIIYQYLKPGGQIRIAVPDANFQNPWYQEMCRPDSNKAKDHPAYTHRVFYDYQKLSSVFTRAGFDCKLLEWCDEAGNFHFTYYSLEKGKIGRSLRFDTRNQDGELGMVSLVVDAVKPHE